MITAELVRALEDHGLLVSLQGELPSELRGLPQSDNRQLKQGDIFIAIKGFSTDGHKYIRNALERGASCIIFQDECPAEAVGIKVSDSRKAAAVLAKQYYHDPSRKFSLLGITGTNGKTTTSLLIFNVLRNLGFKAGWIGTLGYYIEAELFETKHTTPDIMELNSILARMADAELDFVVMEVSSHAIALDRVYGLEFDYCLFSNLSRDHLDFHHSMAEYAQTKYSWLESCCSSGATALINTDDKTGAEFNLSLKSQNYLVKTVGSANGDYQIRDVVTKPESSTFSLLTPGQTIEIRSPLIGTFNVLNLALAASTLDLMGMGSDRLGFAIAGIDPVKGRFERVPNQRGIGVYVDYAHTPDAIENVLRSCKDMPHKRLLCLLGAGGDRDHGKRPLMLQAALHNCDAVIITDDNPRSENPEQIIYDILSGTDNRLPWWVIRDRKTAIESIIDLAQPGDIVVLCGKGHETYQEIEGVRHDFDDYKVAWEHLNGSVRPNREEEALALPLDLVMLKYLCASNIPNDKAGYIAPVTLKHISTDSRKLSGDSVFFAIKGERFDGNDFIPVILTSESIYTVGERDCGHERSLHCDDPLVCLAEICRKYLHMFGVYKIALTGSTGKTSTKELMAAVLEAGAPTLRTAKNENNLIGLCQTILRLKSEHRFAVFELGTNHFGEIAALGEIVNPACAVIINIGPSHLEFLEDEAGVFREKIALFQRPLQHRVFPAGDERFDAFRDGGKSVGTSEAASVSYSVLERANGKTRMLVNGFSFILPTEIPHMADNAAFAIAVGLLLGLEPDTIQKGLYQPLDLENRLQRLESGGRTLLLDCYNANPVSMHKAIEYWLQVEPQKPHWAILGDMLELGREARNYHSMIGAILAEKKLDGLVTVGDLSRLYAPEALASVYHFDEVGQVLQSGILSKLDHAAIVLVKGSHGIHLERLIPALKGEN